MNVRRVCIIAFLLFAGLPAAAQDNRVVALVIAVGQETERADAMQAQLQAAGAETLRANNPNNAQLRSILTRFAREAANSRATFVYLDTPLVDFQGKSFVLPAEATLNRGTDLFTQALPLQAFSRSAGQAGQGGATIATLSALPLALPEGTQPTASAPAPASPVSPILVGPDTIFPGMIAGFEAALESQEVEVSTLLRRLSTLDGVSISEFPNQPIYLREKPQDDPKPAAVVLPEEPAEEPAEEAATADALPERQPDTGPETGPQETLEELNLLEQALSRAAKRSVQTQLRSRGLYAGLVDGIFGPQTRAAIEAFQAGRNESQTGVLTRRQLIDLSS